MKNKWHRSTLLGVVAFSLLFFVMPLAAAETTLQIKCVDSSGAAVGGAKVVMYNMKTQKSKDKKSDAQGVAEFKAEDGVYRIFARKEGFAPAFNEFVSLPASSEAVTLKMAAGADRKLYFEDPAEEQRGQGLLIQGLDQLKQGKPAEAEKFITESLTVNPSNAEAAYYLSYALLQQSKFDQAMEVLNRAEQLARVNAGLPQQNPQAAKAYEQIIANAQQTRKKLPAMKGEAANKARNYEQAAKEFGEAVKQDPNNPENYANMAIALTNAGKFEEGIAALDKAIQLKPGAFADLRKTIVARQENAAIDKARVALEEGNKLLQAGDGAAALQKFEDAQKLVPQSQQYVVIRQVARAQAKINQHDAAVASFKKSVELAPADKLEEYRNSFAQYYLDNKKFDEALDVLADPKNSSNPENELLELAKKAKDKQPVLAEAALERVIKTNPANIEAHYDLGQLYYMDGKEKDATTKQLLTRYVESGKDAARIDNAKSMLIIINRRSK